MMLVFCQALPLCRYSEVMGLAVGRLMDKSINVVKSAIQLLAAFIAHNPYSCKVIKTQNGIRCDVPFAEVLRVECCVSVEQCRSKEPSGEGGDQTQRAEGEGGKQSTR